MIKKVIISFLIIIAILAGAIWGGIYYYVNKIPREAVNQLTLSEDPSILQENGIPTSTNGFGSDIDALNRLAQENNNYKDVTNILLLGIDSQDGVGRSDSMMIFTVDKAHKKIKLTSLLRDSYVYIAGHGMDKMNHAYAFGGSSLALRTVNTNFDMNIKDFVTVDFNDIVRIVDNLGGLDVELTSAEAKLVYADGKGLNHLNGKQTLMYARIRHLEGGDFQRTSRQRKVITLILDKLLSLSPMEMVAYADTLLPMVKTSLDSGTILGLGSTAAMGGYKIVQDSYPEEDTSEGMTKNGIWYLKWNKEETISKLHDFIYNE